MNHPNIVFKYWSISFKLWKAELPPLIFHLSSTRLCPKLLHPKNGDWSSSAASSSSSPWSPSVSYIYIHPYIYIYIYIYICVCVFPRTKIATNLGHLRPSDPPGSRLHHQSLLGGLGTCHQAGRHQEFLGGTDHEPFLIPGCVLGWGYHIPCANILYLHTYIIYIYIYYTYIICIIMYIYIIIYVCGKQLGKSSRFYDNGFSLGKIYGKD